MNAKLYIDSEASTIRAEGNVTEVLAGLCNRSDSERLFPH